MKIEKIFSANPTEKKELENYTGNLLRGKIFGFDLVLCGDAVEKLINRILMIFFCLILLFTGFHEQANLVLKVLVGLF
jgi:hypothetical protein